MLERGRLTRLISAWAFVLIFGVQFTALAGDKEKAKRHFQNGLSMMEMEDFSGAVVEFEASVALFQSQGAMFNLAMCYKALHRYPKALETFRGLLKRFGETMTDETRKEVRKNIRAMSKMIAKLEVSTNLPNAIVLINGVKVGTTPLDSPLTVSAGEQRIRVSLDGYEDGEQTVSIAGGAKEVVNFTLTPVAAGGGAPVVAPVSPEVAAKAAEQEASKQEMVAAETALGMNLARDYRRYSHSRIKDKMSFTEYEYRLARKKRTGGIIVVTVVAPIVFGISLGLYFGLQAAKGDPSDDNDYTSFADTTDDAGNEALDNLSYVMLALGGTGAIIAIIVGSVKWGRGAKRMRRLKPLLKDKASNDGIRFVGFSPVLDKNGALQGASAGFSF